MGASGSFMSSASKASEKASIKRLQPQQATRGVKQKTDKQIGYLSQSPLFK